MFLLLKVSFLFNIRNNVFYKTEDSELLPILKSEEPIYKYRLTISKDVLDGFNRKY